ncbi:MAG: S9 family peptidase [Anaerolineae bacterium]|nr:S9 family peptidase [Anaerolineae bacterium]
MIDLETLLRVPHVDPWIGFGPSPDGCEVAFSHNQSGQWEIYAASLVEARTMRRLSMGPGAHFGPQWAPAGDRLAWVVDIDGGEVFDVEVHDVPAGETVNITPGTPDSIQPEIDWSPDGGEIAFASDRGGSFDTYAMPSSGGVARCVWASPRPHWGARWSPNGRHLAVVVEAGGQDTAIYVTGIAGGDAQPIGHGNEPIPACDPAWSPNGKRLAFSSNAGERHRIGIYDLASGTIEWLTGEDTDANQADWAPDGRTLAYVVSHGALTEIALLDLFSRRVRTFQVAPGVHHRPRFTGDRHVVFAFDNPAHPADLWLLDIVSGDLGQVTHSLPEELQGVPWAMPDVVSYPSLDGTEVPALLYRPPQPGVEAPPAVITIHGGPNWLTQVTWDPVVQHMVSRGWAVLAPNYRGSTGYGRAWQIANRFDLGGGDTRDVVAGADYLVREGLADPQRIALTGRSWGGYLTMTSMTAYPGRWAAGSAVVPFLNWFTGHANSRADLQHWDLENFGHPERDRDLYYERSPFFFLDNVTAPVQLICGAHDPRCPASESIQARDALIARGKPCELVLYEDEGHSFLKTENVVDAERRRISFLADALE